MQVSLSPAKTRLTQTAAAHTHKMQQAACVSSPAQVTPAADFPEPALLSRKPARYNIQLNAQLTAIQQAEDYLQGLEGVLLHYRHTKGQPGSPSRDTAALQQQLAQRLQRSAGTVDRQLNISLTRDSQVHFSLGFPREVFSQPQGETLIFAAGKGYKQLAAVTLPEAASPRQILAHLNASLGKFGIHGEFSPRGECLFTADESRWDTLKGSLRVRGEGIHFPADSFTLLSPVSQASPVDSLQQLTGQWDKHARREVEQVLHHITHQQTTLRQHKASVTERIREMSPALTTQHVQQTAQGVGQQLASSRNHFEQLARSLAAQANIPQATVRHLLG
ncbi:hypothetical protein [Mangrovibacter phragmitis]|uniref:hypothetical protein n=1 Tax=Mangrovibacter phragmitis TaxID=1691903 RepID=UPI003511186D